MIYPTLVHLMEGIDRRFGVRSLRVALGLAGALLTLAVALAATSISALASARKAPPYFARGALSQSSGNDAQGVAAGHHG